MDKNKAKFTCDRCGFDFPRSQMLRDKGLMVDKACFDAPDPNSRVNWGFYGKQAHGDKTVTTITVTGITKNEEHMLLVGDGAITITGDPAIAAGVTDKERLTLEGTSDDNSVTLTHGNGISLWKEKSFTLKNGDVICLIWNADTTTWVETSRSWYYERKVAGRYI